MTWRFSILSLLLVPPIVALAADPPPPADESATKQAAPPTEAPLPQQLAPEQEKRLAEAQRLNSQLLQLLKQGKYREALPLAKQILAIREGTLGIKHADTRAAMNVLADIYSSIVNSPKLPSPDQPADQNSSKATTPPAKAPASPPLTLEQRKRQQEVLDLLKHVLQLFKDKKYDEAMTLAKQAQSISMEALGPKYPLTSTATQWLGILLIAQGDHAAARPYYEQVLAIKMETLGNKHVDVATSYFILGSLQRKLGDNVAARGSFEQALAIREESLGAGHTDTLAAMKILAALYKSTANDTAALSLPRSTEQEQRLAEARQLNSQLLQLLKQAKFREALPLAKQALAIRKEVLGEKHLDTATSLNNLGRVLDSQADYAAARRYYQQALAIRKEVLGEKHPDTAGSLNNLGVLLYSQGDYASARRYYEQVLAICKEVLGDKHPDTATSLHNLGVLLYSQGDYAAARRYYEQALAIRKEVLGEKHPDTATSLNNLGVLLNSQGDYAAARPYYEQALAICKEVLGEKHPDTATSLNNLGGVHQSQADYAAARPYFEQALAIRKEVLGEKHPDTAGSLNNLGALLNSQADYAAARPYFEQALAIRKEVLGEKHPDTATSLNNLGALLNSQGDYAAARPYYEQALAICKEVLGEKHPATATSLNNLGALLNSQGDYAAARPYYEQALAIRKEVLGEKHPDTATSLNNLGTLLTDQGDYAAARPYYEQALAIRKEVLGEKHPDTATSLSNLGSLLVGLEEWDAGAAMKAEAVQISHSLRDTLFATASEAEALNYLAAEALTQDALISIWRHTTRSADTLYGHLWQGRAALFDITASRSRALGASVAPDVQSLYQAWLDARREVARLTLAQPDPNPQRQTDRRQRLAEAVARKEQQERELAHKLPDFARQRTLMHLPYTALLQALPLKTVFVDLLRYTRFEHDSQTPGRKGDSRTPSYVAFVLARGQKVRRVDLGPAAPIDQAAAAWRQAIVAGNESPAGDELSRLVWQPIADTFSVDIQTVYLVPGGPLTSLPWPALPGKAPGKVLLEEYAVTLVPNGQTLLDQLTHERSSGDQGKLLAVGGVNYDAAPSSSLASRARVNPQRVLAALRAAPLDEKSPLHWAELPGTLAEVAQAQRLAHARTVVQLSGGDASTSRVLEELPQARWAMFATHGFFADRKLRSALQLDEIGFERQQLMTGGERKTAAGRNPLLLSGLVFSGANLPRAKDSFGVPQGDGGILTAEEIAGLRLQNLELAMLSACETGLGDVAGGEGVFGLQRAFHQAGCRNVVASLWKVDDQATAALMGVFYEQLWQAGKTPLDALRGAQLALYRNPDKIASWATRGPGKLVNLPDGGKIEPETTMHRAPPRLWAAFILSGSGN